MVERKQSQRDQRAIEVFLTDKGALIQHDIEKEIDNIGEKIKSEVEKDQKESLLESLFSFQWILRKFFLKK